MLLLEKRRHYMVLALIFPFVLPGVAQKSMYLRPYDKSYNQDNR